RPLLTQCGVRLIIGKGGLGAGSLAAFQELAGAYLACIGGTAALETTWITAIEDVDLDELHPERLWPFSIRGFGRLRVVKDIEGGAWLPNQELAWMLVNGAIERIRELENELGCFFDRNPDGTIHQKAFAGQTFNRTVHKGDLTGIEIVNRLSEQVWARGIHRLEEHRALKFITSAEGSSIAGVILLDIRTGDYVYAEAKAVL